MRRCDSSCGGCGAAFGITFFPCAPALVQAQEAGDDAGAAKDIAQRVSFNARVATAAPFGRALLTYGTAFPSHADPVAVPVLTLACVAMPREVLMRTDLSAISSSFSGVCDWPEFHNGVAAGLRLAPGAHQQTTRTWVVYNKPAGGRWVGAGCGAPATGALK